MNKLEKYIRDHYDDEEIKLIATHGCANGYGPIYYNETTEIFKQFAEEIFELEDEIGTDFLTVALKDCHCCFSYFANTAVWSAFELICMSICPEFSKDSEYIEEVKHDDLCQK